METVQPRPDRGTPRPSRRAFLAVSAGQASGDGWSAAVSILTGYDPGAVFSNPFLDTLFG